MVPFDESGVKHREERRYFLRLQVLREVATGVKQRLGLEPWGRVRVEYAGLDAALPFFQSWAPRLGLTPRRCEGVAALLDHLRRIRALHDNHEALREAVERRAATRRCSTATSRPSPGGPKG
ncbi:MAG: hypothetical protein IPI35_20560 [Deltaproteobacteria bacterium]|nr:hypothetical protein [Deltaproteobacteria bacterium]